MIPPNSSPWESRVWREELARAYRSSNELLRDLGLPQEPEHDNPFRTLVPRPFVARMKKGERADPLLLQVLASKEELLDQPGFSQDPLQEANATRAPGLIQKYAHRALLITTSGCAVNCRYCFRRHFPYQDHRPSNLDAALFELEQDSSIEEIILSGGDPLLLADEPFKDLLDRLDAIPHIKRIRIHTRLPIVLPQRVTSLLLTTLQQLEKQRVLVVHCNHAAELDEATGHAFQLLRATGTTLLNQAVLLAGINDSVACQTDLAEALFEQGVLPYYLHLPDPISGTHHFYIDNAAAVDLHNEIHARLPGYLVPRLVKEVAGEPGKSLIFG